MFAASLVKEYGIDLVLADKQDLIEFKARQFERYLEEKVKLSDEQWELLTYLAGSGGTTC